MEAKNRKAGIGTYGGCKTVLNIDPKDPVARSNACRALANVLISTKGHVLVGGDMNFGGSDLKVLKGLVTELGGTQDEVSSKLPPRRGSKTLDTNPPPSPTSDQRCPFSL